MRLKCHRLDLTIEPLSKAGPEGWLHFRVNVKVPGFIGNIETEMQVEDWERFRDDLKQMEQNVGLESESFLGSAEPGIYLSFKSNKLGTIIGAYQLESDRYDGEPTVLSGAFEIDQTFLKSLINTVSADIMKIK